METREHVYIGGEFVPSTGTGTIEVVNPHTEQVIARVPDGTEGDMDRAVAAARQAFDGPWADTTPAQRAEYLTKLSQLIQSRMDLWAGTISQEMGSPFSFSQMGQIFASSMVLDYYAG
ncbi:MAG: aldehyde dehydrogenase family protein, partial [Mycobacteriales bacterium]